MSQMFLKDFILDFTWQTAWSHHVWISGNHGNRPRLCNRSNGNAGPASQWTDCSGPRCHPGCTTLCHPVPTDPNCTGKTYTTCFHILPRHKELEVLSLVWCICVWFICLFQISTLAESEDSQESVDSVTDSQKRREILSRRPSYR